MREITKLYENAGIKSFKTCEFCTQKSIDCLKENISNITCGFASDMCPPFTAEKQLELIKWLIKEVDTLQMWYFGPRHNCYDFDLGSRNSTAETFEECFAGLVNKLWQDLTSEEKEQIRNILEGQ